MLMISVRELARVRVAAGSCHGGILPMARTKSDRLAQCPHEFRCGACLDDRSDGRQ